MELLVIGLLGTIDLVATLMDLIGIAQECKRSIDLVAVLIGSYWIQLFTLRSPVRRSLKHISIFVLNKMGS